MTEYDSLDTLTTCTPQSVDVVIGLTEVCNCKCAYCGLHQVKSDQPLRHMDDHLYAKAIALCRDLGASHISLQGGGETMMYPGWTDKVESLLHQGFAVGMSTNFAKRISWHEAQILTYCTSIAASVDTADPELLARIRRGLDLETLVYNMELVRSAAAYLNRPCPPFSWTCVFSNLVAKDIKKLAALATACRVTCLTLTPLQKYCGPADGLGLDFVTQLPRDELKELLGPVQESINLLQSNGVRLVITPSMIDDIRSIVLGPLSETPNTRLPQIMELEAVDMSSCSHTLKPVSGETRDCNAPWSILIIPTDG
ncbi:MAG: radical SAM protein, partial [Chitinivibrionales bacterium]|nr:radical SAM protein [Chitinivibrionales bacterium]